MPEEPIQRTFATKRLMAAAICSITLGVSGAFTWLNWVEYRHTQTALDYTQIISDLANLAGEMAVERGVTAGILGAEGEAAPVQITIIQTRRKQIAAYLASADAALETSPLVPALDDRIKALRQDWTVIEALRKRVDAMIADAAPGKDPSLMGEWFPSATTLIDDVAGLRRSVETALTPHVNTADASLIALHDAMLQWAEYAGRDRGTLAGIIAAGQPFSDAQRDQLEGYETAIENAAHNVDQLKETLSPGLRTMVEGVQLLYLESYQDVRKRVIAAGLSGRTYPMASPEWFKVASRTIGSILNVTDVLRERVRSDLRARRGAGLPKLMSGLVVMALSTIGLALLLLAPTRGRRA